MDFDRLTAQQAHTLLRQCCDSPLFAQRVVQGRPYGCRVLDVVEQAVLALPDTEVGVAVAAHPRIGAPSSDARSAREQAGAQSASHELRAAFARSNAEYESRFGRIYLVCAAGRSGTELLALLEQRLHNDPDVEWNVTRTELAKIARLRLSRILAEGQQNTRPRRIRDNLRSISWRRSGRPTT
jgi:2-oxo-4-hydroxy-4-carboxy-5-ureidoimidazoline decarboxylase